MPLDAVAVARFVTEECGLAFAGHRRTDTEIELRPAGVPAQNAFTLKIATGWRSIELSFIPGVYSADLIADMGSAGQEARRICSSVLTRCAQDGATVSLRIDGTQQPIDTPDQWPSPWSRFELSMRKGQIDFDEDSQGLSSVPVWAGRLSASVVALLPLEELDDTATGGFPEGAAVQVVVNRYERDRRNRAAAIAIHGVACVACRIDMGQKYGAAAAGLIEVHHLTPVSQLGEGYILNPATDLVPLCPNCHGVVHRREPPFTPAEVSRMLAHQEMSTRLDDAPAGIE
jgi:5-methylcytosine-specific restriction protein A